MPVESLTLTPPSGSSISLSGTKWGLLDFDLGNPQRRDEMVSSQDASGSMPFRVAPRENREVTVRLQLLDAAGNMNTALDSVGALEALLERAENIAAEGWVDPVAESVRLVYTPAGATSSYSLIVLTGEITGVPKVTTGDDAGYFLARPIVTVRFQCDPFAYGAVRTYLDATTTLSTAVSNTVAGGPGDISPWIRSAFKDVATQSRGRLIVGLKKDEASTTPTLPASGWTAIAGTYNAGPPPFMFTNSTDTANWQTLCSLPRQTRTGSFRVYAHRCYNNNAASPGQIRLAWCPVGSALNRNEVVIPTTGAATVYLGEVNVTSSWDAWLETRGSVYLTDIILVPVDSYMEVTSPMSTNFMVGAKAAEDALQTTSTHIGGRSLTTGGTWTTTNSISPTWPVSAANWARRSAVSMGTTPAFAQAGTGNHIAVNVQANVKWTAGVPPVNSSGLPMMGVYARWVDASNYVVFGPWPDGSWGWNDARPRLAVVTSGVAATLWTPDNLFPWPSGGLSNGTRVRLQITADGRWAVAVTNSNTIIAQASGHNAVLAQGATLGNASAAKAGIFDLHQASSACDRDTKDFSISPLVGVTPAPIPSGATLTQSGVRLRNSDGAEYTYVGSSGIDLRPGANNNLTVVAHRSPGVHGVDASTDPLDIDIDGYPRFLSVPHT
jgi:hypothetical protein